LQYLKIIRTRPRSLKSTILWLFIPIIVGLILVTGLISYNLATQQLEANAYAGINDTVIQTNNFLNDRLTATLNDLIKLNNDPALLALLRQLQDPLYQLQPQDYIEMNKSLERIFLEHYSQLDAILLSFNQGRFTLLKNDYPSGALRFSFEEYATRYPSGLANLHWRNLHTGDLFTNLYEPTAEKVVSVFQLLGTQNSAVKGIILLQLRASFFRNILIKPQISPNGYLLLVSPDGQMSFKEVEPKYQVNQEFNRKLNQLEASTGRFTFNNSQNQKMVVIYDTLSVNRWRLAAVFPEDELLDKINSIKYISLLVILAVIGIALLLSGVLAQIITRPLARLTHNVNKIQEGNLDVKFEVLANNEIGTLNRSIGELMSRVKGLLAQVEEEQAKKRAAELSALQAQIHPHFCTIPSIRLNNCAIWAKPKAPATWYRLSLIFFGLVSAKGKKLFLSPMK
jgi:two-component system, sensor histidine kinase YesM